MFNRLNKVQIHCWGGLGSQLNAWATAEAIKQKFKHKSVAIILHTGGVTKRISEIDFLSPRFEIKIIDDFHNKSEDNNYLHRFRAFVNRMLKWILDKIGLILNDEQDSILYRVKMWTLSLRGHYSNETLSEQVIYAMLMEIEKYKNQAIKSSLNSTNILGIHYRLGDLLELKEKSFVSPEVLGKFFLNFYSTHVIDHVYVYSDSPKFAQISLGTYLESSTKYLDKEIWNTLVELCNYKYFIGTNSKISIWVSLFRNVKDIEANVCLPTSMKNSLSQIYPKIVKSTNTVFY